MTLSVSKELLDSLLYKFSSLETCSTGTLEEIRKILIEEPVLRPISVNSRGGLMSSRRGDKNICKVKEENKVFSIKKDTVDRAEIGIKVFNESLKVLSQIVKKWVDSKSEIKGVESKKNIENSNGMGYIGLAKHIVNCLLLSFKIVKENSIKLNIKELGVCKAHANIINRLIDLEMISMAFQELIILRNDLESYIRLIVEQGFWAKSSKKNRLKINETNKAIHEIVSWLINVESPVDCLEEDVVNFIVGFQLMALRSASRHRDMTLDESLLNSFKSRFGPMAFFRRLNQLNPTLGKNQANLLYRIVLKLCSSHFSYISFQFQLCTIGCLHEENISNNDNIMDGILRVIMHLSKMNDSPSSYSLCKEAIENFLNSSSSGMLSRTAFINLIFYMSFYAEQIKNYIDVLNWNMLLINKFGQNDIISISLSFHNAFFELSESFSIENGGYLKTAKDNLSKLLSMDEDIQNAPESELVKLIKSMDRLRRSCISAIDNSTSNSQFCRSLLEIMLEFVRKYNVNNIGEKECFKVLGFNILTSIISFVKTDLTCSVPNKDDHLIHLLDISLEFAKSVNDTSAIISISNVFWNFGIILHQNGDNAIDPVQRSILALESINFSNLDMDHYIGRYELLIKCYSSIKDYENSVNYCLKAMDILFKSGIISQIASKCNCAMLSDVFKEHRHVARIITSIVQNAIVGECWSERCLLKHLNICERGPLLEWQLQVVFGLQYKYDISKQLYILQNDLMDIYNENFPIRRMRVLLQIYQCLEDINSDMNDTYEELFRKSISDLMDNNLLEDIGFESFRYNYIALSRSFLALKSFLNQKQWQDDMKAAFKIWKMLFDDIEHSKTQKTLGTYVDNPLNLLCHFEMLTDFFLVKGLPLNRLAVLKLRLRLCLLCPELRGPGELTKIYAMLGLQYLYLGYTGKAGMIFATAQNYNQKMTLDIKSLVEFEIAYIEYLSTVGCTSSSWNSFIKVAKIVNGNFHIWNTGIQVSLDQRIEWYSLVASGSFVYALIMLEKGAIFDAFHYVENSYRLYKRIIKNAVKYFNKDISLLNKENTVSTCNDNCKKPAFFELGRSHWKILNNFISCLLLLAKLYEIQGSVLDSEYFYSQALEVAENINSYLATATILVMLGNLYVKIGKFEKGQENFYKAKYFFSQIENIKESVSLLFAQASLQSRQKLWCLELESYLLAEKLLKELMSPEFIIKLDEIAMENVVIGIETMTLSSPSNLVDIKKPSFNKLSTQCECIVLSRLKGKIMTSKGYNFALQGKITDGKKFLKESVFVESDMDDLIIQRLYQSKVCFLEAEVLLQNDPIYGVLQDSVISVPNIYMHRVSDKSATNKVKTRLDVSKSGLNGSRGRILSLLEETKKNIIEIFNEALNYGQSTLVRQLAQMMASATILQSALYIPGDNNQIRSIVPSYFLEISKMISFQRERAFLRKNTKLENNENHDVQWPLVSEEVQDNISLDHKIISSELFSELFFCDISQFQHQFIDKIPQSWTILTIGVGESKNDLYITRLQRQLSPLVLRLPLNRSNSRDADQDTLTYDNVFNELNEIIFRSNETAQIAKNINTSAHKVVWWKERQELDAKLKQLLINVEHCWLGGFKGIFFQSNINQESFSKFKISVNKIIAKHVFSRKIVRKNKNVVTFEIEPRLLELFVKLDLNDSKIDEYLEDLIYFILDIFQFHGETVAYDEIDIDQMVVDFQEAISNYNKESTVLLEKEQQHLILVLDKSIQSFPWESLPCLRKLSISRVPSLYCIYDRINSAKFDAYQKVSRNNGCYVLNPSSDLINTQNNFEILLKNLEGWEGIVGKEPDEPELQSFLTSFEIFLYFGHGGGEQYIRKNTIKRLSKCAVSFLMGCSSGLLKDMGDFEPIGMAISYLLAGCPALVANLWDVTDKDIDRFSTSVLKHWGLISNDLKNCQDHTAPKIGNSLVDAITFSRDQCVLKYLNGAAPVIYGVPIYLE
ncbi:hypothetical protein T552_02075 [Pneumocystis carinii B80]|uniref:separase n=1 Tax=Pneumocystis carinii (strain B80) TaxID=1408658 RepID=A0A0W4ZGY8_PNEC8|nr:hypothetical protein T552_02075 [Pneumocystis carinii B80]KTW27634.1 hypothetical protein T552_02075 [Pneumocystis carinii B80]